ncbi:aminopeptidase P family protein [Anaplasmataceae bacterium AB001_6]|nr:aminopeptidase P family protein [Anaplasmataceae bacterium AB001_6]
MVILKMLKKLIEILISHDVDYFILPINDESFFEYVPDYNNRIKFVTKFTGSNAFIILSVIGKNLFFTDSRYILQAKKEIDLSEWDIFNFSDKNPYEFINNVNYKVGFDPKIIDYRKISDLKCQFIAFDKNPIDDLRSFASEISFKIFNFDIKYSGLKSLDKIKKFSLPKPIFINQSDSICWLLNLRGNQFAYTPIFFCYAILYPDCKIDLFIDKKNASIENELESHISVFDFVELEDRVKNINTIFLINNEISSYVYEMINNNVKTILFLDDDIISNAQCIKNSVEINGMRLAHVKDGIACTKFLHWLDENKKNKKIKLSESIIADKIFSFRVLDKDFFYESFSTISAYNENGALIHYNHINNNMGSDIQDEGLLLLDSGGQYHCGTTDITRTISIGNQPTEEQKFHYTIVLKGMIALSRMIFPKKTKCYSLDAIARQFLWQYGLNYQHGTGHGIGCFLSVHECPPSFSSNTILQEGMLISNEPGVYFKEKYGIRIENILLVKSSKYEDFLEFENLTRVPLDINLIDFNLLDDNEKYWIYDDAIKIKKLIFVYLEEKEQYFINNYVTNLSKFISKKEL